MEIDEERKGKERSRMGSSGTQSMTWKVSFKAVMAVRRFFSWTRIKSVCEVDM